MPFANTTEIPLLNPDQTQGMAQVGWDCVGETYTIHIAYGDRLWQASGYDYFEALRNVRHQFEPEGYRLLCYGASLDVWPSGMCRDMGEGLKAYKLPQDDTAKPQLFGIFETGPDVVAATYQAQRAFSRRWHAARRGKE